MQRIRLRRIKGAIILENRKNIPLPSRAQEEFLLGGERQDYDAERWLRRKGTDVPASTLHPPPQKPGCLHQTEDGKERGTEYLALGTNDPA